MKPWIRSCFAPALMQLDLRLHREILRLRLSYQLSLDEFRGLYISDAQVDALISRQLQSQYAAHDDIVSISDLQQRIDALNPLVSESWMKDPAWKKLQYIFSLTSVELDIILLVIAPELDSKYETLYAYLNNDIARKYPTTELLMRLAAGQMQNQYRQALGEHGKLAASGILSVQSGNNNYQLHSALFLARTLIDFLLYDSPCPPDPAFLRALPAVFQPWNDLPVAEETLVDLDHYRQQLILTDEDQQPRIKILVQAKRHSAATMLLTNLFIGAGLNTFSLNLVALFDNKDSFKAALNQAVLYLALHPVAVIVDFQTLSGPREQQGELTRYLIEVLIRRVPRLALIITPGDWRQEFLSRYSLHHLTLSSPGVSQRSSMWQRLARTEDVSLIPADAQAVAEFFNLDYQQIEAAVRQLKLQQQSGTVIEYKQVATAATAQSYSEISDLALKVNNNFQFSDLILPADIRARIQEIIFAARNRQLVFDEWDFAKRTGNVRGIMALFAGASGTGKTMSASVIANHIGLDLYRVDLSRVVSKYIGETEKNLDKIFNAAHQANCILFIDEADALLGKRSEVKDAHDRNANVEVAFLLQKMEAHDGLVILTTNLAKNIDSAFTRRLQFVIDFPKPDEHHRELIWKSMFGEKSPLHTDVDFNFLARQFNNTGGDIKNIALDAALLAAESEHKRIDMPLLIRACARQMIKQGKLPSANEFKHFFALVSNN